MARREYLTLTAATVGSLPLTAGAGTVVTRVRVANAGTGACNFTVDGTTPTVDGDDTYRLDPGEERALTVPAAATVTVKAISAGTPNVEAEVLASNAT